MFNFIKTLLCNDCSIITEGRYRALNLKKLLTQYSINGKIKEYGEIAKIKFKATPKMMEKITDGIEKKFGTFCNVEMKGNNIFVTDK